MQTFIQKDLGPQPLLAEISAREGVEFSNSTPAEITASLGYKPLYKVA
jgi:hypothetical protein